MQAGAAAGLFNLHTNGLSMLRLFTVAADSKSQSGRTQKR